MKRNSKGRFIKQVVKYDDDELDTGSAWAGVLLPATILFIFILMTILKSDWIRSTLSEMVCQPPNTTRQPIIPLKQMNETVMNKKKVNG